MPFARNGSPLKGRNRMKKKESIFLHEYFMAATCFLAVAASVGSLIFGFGDGDSFALFGIITKLVTAVAMYLAFRFYKWDVAKGLMGGILFCMLYQEAHLVLGKLWSEQDFDAYLTAGVQGSLYLAAAGMTFLMTIIITVNHFFISYATHGNPKNVILNRIAILFKLVVYILLFAVIGKLGFPAAALWKNAFQYVTDIALLLLLVSTESQFDTFNALRQEMLKEKREARNRK